MLRPDLVFSYWIFFWYILYIFHIKNKYNPKFGIILGIIENLILLFFMLFYKTKLKLVVFFFIMLIIMKIIPFLTLIKTKINKKDIFMTFFLFILYIVWLNINNMNLYDLYNKSYDLIHNKKDSFPGVYLFNSITSKFL